MFAVVYMRSMLPESDVIGIRECLIQSSGKAKLKISEREEMEMERSLFKSLPSFEEVMSLLKSRLVKSEFYFNF